MPDFFDEVDSIGIIEQHIQQVLRLEESKAKILLERYKQVRQELRDRLSRTRANTFTQQQMRGVLAQVEGAIIAMNSSLKGNMDSAALDMALQGTSHLTSEIQKLDKHFTGAIVPINLNAQVVAMDTKNFLLTQYEASIDAYGDGLIGQLTGNLTQAALMEMSYGQTIMRLDQFFEGEEWKLHRIARTELHNVYNIGKMNGMSDLIERDIIPDLMKTLMHKMDSRTGADSMYAASKNLIARVDEPFRYKWKGKERVFMAPPDRPNDRAILVPYRKEWNTAQT